MLTSKRMRIAARARSPVRPSRCTHRRRYVNIKNSADIVSCARGQNRDSQSGLADIARDVIVVADAGDRGLSEWSSIELALLRIGYLLQDLSRKKMWRREGDDLILLQRMQSKSTTSSSISWACLCQNMDTHDALHTQMAETSLLSLQHQELCLWRWTGYHRLYRF